MFGRVTKSRSLRVIQEEREKEEVGGASLHDYDVCGHRAWRNGFFNLVALLWVINCIVQLFLFDNRNIYMIEELTVVMFEVWMVWTLATPSSDTSQKRSSDDALFKESFSVHNSLIFPFFSRGLSFFVVRRRLKKRRRKKEKKEKAPF